MAESARGVIVNEPTNVGSPASCGHSIVRQSGYSVTEIALKQVPLAGGIARQAETGRTFDDLAREGEAANAA